MTNPCNPLGPHVLVRVGKVEEKTNGGIILPDNVRDKEKYEFDQGEVLAMGPLAYDEWGGAKRWGVEIGNKVIFPKHAGRIVGDDCYLINDNDVLAVV